MTPLAWEGAACSAKVCGAPISWAQYARSNKRVPLDRDPGVDKAHTHTVVDPVGGYRGCPVVDLVDQVPERDLFSPEPAERLRYSNHFATCPAADTFRKPR